MSTNNRAAQTGGPGRQDSPGPGLGTGLTFGTTGSDTSGGPHSNQTSLGGKVLVPVAVQGPGGGENSPNMLRGSSDPTTGLKVGSPRSHQASNTHPHMRVPSSFLQHKMLA